MVAPVDTGLTPTDTVDGRVRPCSVPAEQAPTADIWAPSTNSKSISGHVGAVVSHLSGGDSAIGSRKVGRWTRPVGSLTILTLN